MRGGDRKEFKFDPIILTKIETNAFPKRLSFVTVGPEWPINDGSVPNKWLVIAKSAQLYIRE